MIVLAGIAFASVGVAAVVLASSVTGAIRRGVSPGRLVFAFAAAALVVVPFGALLVSAFCGFN